MSGGGTNSAGVSQGTGTGGKGGQSGTVDPSLAQGLGSLGSSGKGGQQQAAPSDPYTNSAQNIQNANNMLLAAANGFARPGNFNPAMYSAATMGATTAGASLIDVNDPQNSGMNASLIDVNAPRNSGMTASLIDRAGSYNPAMSASPSTIASGMSRYQNPYTDQVINRTTADMQRNNEMQLQNVKAAAARSGAFGGSRHGLVEAETNAENTRAIGDMSGTLRNQMFNTAANLSAQDVSNNINVNSMNQNAANQAGQFNANSSNLINQANQNSANNAGSFNASLRSGYNLANQNAANNAGAFNASLRSGYNLANQNAQNSANQYNATNQFNANANNMSAVNTARSNNANAANNMLVNRNNNDIQRNQGLMTAASGMSGLGSQNFNIGQAIGNQQMAQGGLLQGMEQLLLDDARGMYNEYTNSPINALNLMNQAAGLSPLNNNQSQTSSRNPGLFDYLGLGLQAGGIAFPRGI